MTKSLEGILDKIKTGATMSAAVTVGGMTLAVIREGVFIQRLKKPVGYAWSVRSRSRHAAEIFVTPADRAVLIVGGGRDCPHIRIDLPERKGVAHV